MALTVANKEFEKAPAGVYLASSRQLIDLGTRTEMVKSDDGQERPKNIHKVLVVFEIGNPLVSEDVEDGDSIITKTTKMPILTDSNGEPFTVWKEYTASFHEKSQFFADSGAYFGKAWTKKTASGAKMDSFLDKTVELTLEHKVAGSGQTYCTIAKKGISPTKNKFKSTMPILTWEVESDEPMPESLAPFHKDKITTSFEYLAKKAKQPKEPEWTAAPTIPAGEDTEEAF